MRTLEELASRWRRPEALHRGPKLRASSRAPRAPRSPACGAPGPTSGLRRAGRLAAAVPCLAGGRTSPVVRGRAGVDAGRSSGAGGRGGGPGPESRVRKAADGSGPYLGSPTPATRHVLPASAPLIPALGGGTPGLPLKQDGCAFVQTAQEIPLQVDMAVALQRLRVAEKYGKSYLCLLQAVFVAESELLLRVKDVSHFLMQDIAFLSGGRGKDNAWIITFPENCNFRCIPEEVVAKVLNYLTSVVRQNGSDSQFTIILDRRLDTWSSLKISLQKIACCHGGNGSSYSYGSFV
ncbi:MCF.2 cell line derived transforming sequence [Rhinolophus ferrumequinum]|uniref:MCF.2 cell line derived transforming sequence n=1 Tax=Rhinolophus ferrumequinum TaxID=59479 RepID=A0A7J8AV44_RHIFE|nr:MCF.2 cell line derived transforming sequence [Rhinolophus ferrumequinum]